VTTCSSPGARYSFRKLYLAPGEEQVVTIPIPEESLMQWDYAMRQRLVPGKIEWFLRDSGETKFQGEFCV